MVHPLSAPPDLSRLPTALADSLTMLARVEEARDGNVSAEGGDVAAHGSRRLIVRHVVNYLAAVDLARRSPVDGILADIGSGVGALGAWAGQKLDTQVYLVDRNPVARSIAARAFPEATVLADISDVPVGSARLVTAMEVLEHVRPTEQPAFVRRLVDLLAPGGVLVISTPDESGYVGGWSGYPPHVGLLSYAEFEALLARNAGSDVKVWRLEGEPFGLGRIRARAEPFVNRAYGTLERRVPAWTDHGARIAAAAGRQLSTLRTKLASWPAAKHGVPPVHATADVEGQGTGLLGVVHKPLEET